MTDSTSVIEPRPVADQTGDVEGRSPIPATMLRGLGTCVLVVSLLLAFIVATSYREKTYARSFEVWNVFHYYLGAKYFSEVGYFSLYSCAIDADYEDSGTWNGIVGVRDLTTYHLVPVFTLPPCPRSNFTPERWAAFSKDVEYFASLAPPGYFSSVFSDKGFNPPPSWVAIAGPLARAVPISSRVTDIVFNLDVVAVLIGILIVWRNRGGVAALLTSGLAIFYFGNFGRIGGNFLQYIWFTFLIAAIVLWTKNRPVLSGVMLGIAVGLQGFPLFFGAPIAVRGIIDLLRGRRQEEWSPSLKFSGAMIAVLLGSFLFGSLSVRGVGAWEEWDSKISTHRAYLQGEMFDIGLANLTALAVSPTHRTVTCYADAVASTFARLDLLKKNIWAYRFLVAAFLSVWVLGLLSAPRGDLFGHGFLLMFAATSLSPYYYLTLAMIPFIFWKSGRMLSVYAIGGTVALFAAHAVCFLPQYVDWRYWPHLLSDCSIALFLLGFAVITIFKPEGEQLASQ